MTRPPIVIVGASLAGGTAAVTLREEGFDGDIILIGAETQLPYNRPPLSKGYLRGQDRFEDQLVKPASYYAEQRIQLKLGVRATDNDVQGRISYAGAGMPLPPMIQPADVFNRLLTGFTESTPELDAIAAEKKSVLDAVQEQFTTLQGRLGAADRAKL